MIVHSPETFMPEPYKSYIRQRADVVADVLHDVVGQTDVQLCPHEILAEEVVFPSSDAIIYGCLVNERSEGRKSVIYNGSLGNIATGKVVRTVSEAEAYVHSQLQSGERVRLKLSHESDGQGQLTVGSIDEATRFLSNHHGQDLVAMPHFNEILDRFTLGVIDLGQYGRFNYVGREITTSHEGREVYGGANIGLFQSEYLGSAASRGAVGY
jgi:hypothetical protein